MSKKQKNTLILRCVAKQNRKESTKIKEHEQETDSSRPTCCTSASQSTEFDLAKERINSERPIITSDDIKILPSNGSNNVDKLNMLKNAFRPVWEAAMAFDLEKCGTAKGQRLTISQRIVNLTKIISEHIHGWYIPKIAKTFIAYTALYFLRL